MLKNKVNIWEKSVNLCEEKNSFKLVHKSRFFSIWTFFRFPRCFCIASWIFYRSFSKPLDLAERIQIHIECIHSNFTVFFYSSNDLRLAGHESLLTRLTNQLIIIWLKINKNKINHRTEIDERFKTKGKLIKTKINNKFTTNYRREWNNR